MRRTRPFSVARRAAITLLVGAVVVVLAGPALAQVTVPPTTASPATTVPPTTVPVAPTTAPATPTTTAPSTATTTSPSATTAVPLTTTADKGSDDGGIPWIPIAIAVIVLGAIVALVAVLARKRGASRQVLVDWRRRAADVTAEAGATARLLSTGTPASGQIAQQLLGSLRAFEDLEQSAPDDDTEATVERGRRALQTLGLAIDSDHQLRRSPQASPDQVTESAASVRATAGEADRALRAVYRTFTDTQ